MRLLFLNHNVARRGGTYYRAYDVARHLAHRGHGVTLLTISAKRRWGFEREVSEGVEIVQTPDLFWGKARSGWDPWDTFSRMLFAWGRTWDIIHAWDCRPAVILPALHARARSRACGARLLTDWCDWFGRGGTQTERQGRLRWIYGPVETFFEEAFRTRADGATVISQALYHRALSLGVGEDVIRLLPQGCETAGRPLVDRATARRRLGVTGDRPVVLSVGTMLPMDAEQLFATLRIVLGTRADCLLALVGRQSAAVPPDLLDAPQVRMTGFVPDDVYFDYMAASDLLLVPMADTLASRARWPSRVNPFLALGRAIVMPRVGDLAQLLEREQAAMIVDGRPDDLARAVLQLLNDPGLRRQYEGRARVVAEETLAWPRLIDSLEDLYRHVSRS